MSWPSPAMLLWGPAASSVPVPPSQVKSYPSSFLHQLPKMGLRQMSLPATVAHSLQFIPFKGSAPQWISWHNYSLYLRGVNCGQWPRPGECRAKWGWRSSTQLCPLNLTVSLMLVGTVIILRWNSSLFFLKLFFLIELIHLASSLQGSWQL